MRIAVLIKQVPGAEMLELLPNGRIRRDGVELEMNACCRRAVAKGVELAAATGGSCVVMTLGPPSAEEVRTVRVVLPAVVSVAERLCQPAKVPAEQRRVVAAERLRRLSAEALGAGNGARQAAALWSAKRACSNRPVRASCCAGRLRSR